MAAIATNLLAVGGFGLSLHHKRAVAKENSVLGAALPEADNAISNITIAVQGGRLSASEAASRLEAVLSTFLSRVSGIIKRDGRAGETGDPRAGGHCNAACVYYYRLRDRVESLKGQLRSLAPPVSTQPDSSKADPPIVAGRFGEPLPSGDAVQAFRATPGASESIVSHVPSDRAMSKTQVYVISGIVFLVGVFLIVRAFSK